MLRRRFIGDAFKVSAFAGAASTAGLCSLEALSKPSGDESMVRLDPDIEPLARLLEESSREHVLERVAERIHAGMGAGPLWAATLLAGARGIEPHPVGFKFHAVMAVNSAAIASREAAAHEHWLPLFWNIDDFKISQEKNAAEGGWFMPQRPNSGRYDAGEARALFREAFETWDLEKADVAMRALAHHEAPAAIFEKLWRYCARDFRNIGHKVIFTANSWRILETLGWRHRVPVLRSLALALQDHTGANPATSDDEADRAGRHNAFAHARIRPDWEQGESNDSQAMLDVWSMLRQADWSEASSEIIRHLNRGLGPAALWDAFWLRAAELLMQQPGVVGVHCVTSCNAMRVAYELSTDAQTRCFLLLQMAAFLTMFREQMELRGELRKQLELDKLEGITPSATGPEAIDEIFAALGDSQDRAAQLSLAWLDSNAGRPLEWIAKARHLIANKATNAHDYKFSVAAFEDYAKLSAPWRSRYLAASVYYLAASSKPDSDVAVKTKQLLGTFH